MAQSKKIIYYDLRAEIMRGKFPDLIGRKAEMQRLSRIINRRLNNNCLVVAPSGAGKTALVRGWLKRIAAEESFQNLQFIQFDTEHLYGLADTEETDAFYLEALATLPPSVLFMDDFGRAAHNNSSLVNRFIRLYAAVLKKPDVRVILTLQPQEYSWLMKKHPAFMQSFDTVTLKNQTAYENVCTLQSALLRLNRDHHIVVSSAMLKAIVDYAERFPALGEMPRSAVSLLDESLAAAKTADSKDLTDDIIQMVVASKTGIPQAKLRPDELHNLQGLEEVLNQSVVGQRPAIAKITSIIQRAALGMRNPNRPMGSFLVLGPSGVGKTETAKLIAEKVFGHNESFTRFDMSEFGQEHTVQRLLGAPPGYTGHESGGALTNTLRAEPHSLILLDEMEKAHPKVFDIFLQVLDDGRLTSGQNETVDARYSIIMATSNVAAAEIALAYAEGSDVHSKEFLDSNILPALTNTFRLEFLNRFDAILVFNPLTIPALVEIARLEIKKIENRLSKHNVRFEIDQEVLARKVETLADPRFGARPVKRFIEETCESLLLKSIFNNKLLVQNAANNQNLSQNTSQPAL